MQNQSVAIARRWFEEVWNERRSQTVFELLTPESTCQSEGGVLRGPEAFVTQVHRPFLTAFPDLRITVVGTVAEGDEVVVRWQIRGTHSGDGFGVPPTGRRISFRGMTWTRCRDGKMMEGLDCWNLTAVHNALRTGESAPSVTVE